jgi:hypothetical protein
MGALMESYFGTAINTVISGAIFVWMIRIERKVAEIVTTCKVKGGCDEEYSGSERRKQSAGHLA